MKKMMIALMLCLMLTGCQKPEAKKQMEYVTGITIDCHYRDRYLYRHYRDSEKLNVITDYLHSLNPRDLTHTVDPDNLTGDSCRIILSLSTGKTRVYHQKGNAYLSVDLHRWQKILEADGNVLYHLINHLESDPSSP